MADLDWLLDRMRQYPDSDALISDGEKTSYSQFLKSVDLARRSIDQAGIEKGDTVAIVGEFGGTTCALLLALIENDNIITPLTTGAYRRNPHFLEISEVGHVFRVDKGGNLTTEKTPSEVANCLNLALKEKRSAGLVLYSSGSTGDSKGAIHDFGRLLEKFRTPRKSLRTLTFLLFDHIGGINTLFYTLSNCGTVVTVSDRSPSSVCRAIEDFRVELLPVSPTFLNLLLIGSDHQDYDLSSLKLITYGTEPMPESTLQRVADCFPDVTLQQTYGLSELGILRSRSKGNRSLWVKMGGQGFDLQVREGVLWIKAESAMLGYLNAPSPFDEEGWFCTQDLVEVEGEYLRILGREEEIINVGGEKVYPAEVESRLLELDNVKDAIVYAEPNPITGQMVVAAIQTEDVEEHSSLKRRIRKALRGKVALFKIPQKIVLRESEVYNERFKRMRLNQNRAV